MNRRSTCALATSLSILMLAAICAPDKAGGAAEPAERFGVASQTVVLPSGLMPGAAYEALGDLWITCPDQREIVRMRNGQVAARFRIDAEAMFLAFSEKTGLIYVTDYTTGRVLSIKPRTDAVSAVSSLGTGILAAGLAVSADGTRIYVVAANRPLLFVVNARSGAVEKKVRLSGPGFKILYAKSLGKVYIGINSTVHLEGTSINDVEGPPEPSQSIDEVDSSSLKLTRTFTVKGAGIIRMAIDEGRQNLFVVTSRGGRVTRVGLRPNSVQRTSVPLDTGLWDVMFDGGEGRLFVTGSRTYNIDPVTLGVAAEYADGGFALAGLPGHRLAVADCVAGTVTTINYVAPAAPLVSAIESTSYASDFGVNQREADSDPSDCCLIGNRPVVGFTSWRKIAVVNDDDWPHPTLIPVPVPLWRIASDNGAGLDRNEIIFGIAQYTPRIYTVDATKYKEGWEIPLPDGTDPATISCDPARTHLFIGDRTTSSVIEVNYATRAVVRSVKLPGAPEASFLAPASRLLYVGSDIYGGENEQTCALSIINTDTCAIIQSVRLPFRAITALAVPNRRTAYFAADGGKIGILDLAPGADFGRFTIQQIADYRVWSLVYDDVSGYLYAACEDNNAGWIAKIDPGSLAVVNRVHCGSHAIVRRTLADGSSEIVCPDSHGAVVIHCSKR